MRKNNKQVKSRIVSAAWNLFYRYGYENTTIDDIVEASNTSKGSFYHYFDSKDALMGSLSYLFDEKYEELMETMPADMGAVEKLLLMNRELFLMIENTVPVTILTQLFSSQLTTKGERHLLTPDRTYYKVLREVALQGKEQGTFREDMTVSDITRAYALFERAMMYDWCLNNGSYSLSGDSQRMLDGLLRGMTAADKRPEGEGYGWGLK